MFGLANTLPSPAIAAALLAALCLTGTTACGGSQEQNPGEQNLGEQAAYRTVQSPPLLDLSVPPAPGEARPFTLPEIREVTLANGLHVVLVDRDGFPTLSVELSIDAGYAAQGVEFAAAELIARTLRDGAGAWDSAEISRRIDANGIAYSASVDHDRTRLSASALSTRFDVVLELLGTLVASPSFPEDRVIARRDELIGELSLAASQPDFHLNRTVRRALFPVDHPYGHAYPSLDDVGAVDRDALAAIWSADYGPAIARLVVVGDLPNDADDRIAAAFGAWTGGPDTPHTIPPATVSTCNEAHVVARPESAQTNIAWLGPGVGTATDGWFEALVANQVLGGGASARLFMNLREDKSYTYGAYSRLDQWGGGVFRATSNVRGEVTEPALDEFVYELDRFGADPLDDLEDAKAYLAGVFPIQHQTNGQIAGAVARLLDRGVPLSYLEDYRSAVSEVDEAAARDAGATLFPTSGLTLVMVGERDIVVPAAVAHASRVYVYDLDGVLVDELPGDAASTCAP